MPRQKDTTRGEAAAAPEGARRGGPTRGTARKAAAAARAAAAAASETARSAESAHEANAPPVGAAAKGRETAAEGNGGGRALHWRMMLPRKREGKTESPAGGKPAAQPLAAAGQLAAAAGQPTAGGEPQQPAAAGQPSAAATAVALLQPSAQPQQTSQPQPQPQAAGLQKLRPAVAVAPMPQATSQLSQHSGEASPQSTMHSGEAFLMEMLAAMDQHMQQLRETQQGLVATVELACRRALDRNFGRLVLVGSAALRVETPGSDVDVVCFTRREGTEAVGLPVDVLRRVHWALKELISQYSDYASTFSMEMIEDARVPILRVLWGPPDHPIAVDVSVDQSRPVDHVRWFQRVGAAPRPTAPPPVVAPLVTLTLRCVKWWLRQRQIPRTKEGGLPTLAWLLMAVHVCSLPETHEQAIVSGQRPMAALLASLAAFFRHYAALERIDGVLQFASDGSASEFRPRKRDRRVDPWAELAVLDPTREGLESLNLAPRLPPATQLLLAHELRRAGKRLDRIPRGAESSPGEARRILEEVLEPLPEGTNNMPSYLGAGGVGALMLIGESIRGGQGLKNLEVAVGVVEHVVPRPGWAAPFVHRNDERSEMHVKLCDVEDRGGRCHPRRKAPIVLSPCHFICRVRLEKDGRSSWRMDAEGLDRYRSMRRYLQDLASGNTPAESNVRGLKAGSGESSEAKGDEEAAEEKAEADAPAAAAEPAVEASPAAAPDAPAAAAATEAPEAPAVAATPAAPAEPVELGAEEPAEAAVPTAGRDATADATLDTEETEPPAKAAKMTGASLSSPSKVPESGADAPVMLATIKQIASPNRSRFTHEI